MASPQFGAIERKPLRDFWSNETDDFTPWLAEDDNLRLLSSAIGLELELVGTEVPVGLYSADIVCRDLDDKRNVVIENQLERTDHRHLGQLLTYAAGLGDVHTVVWIASRFTDEHRAALDWLNRSTAEDVRFFGIEVEVWQIGDSLPAPRFTLVPEPNDWSKSKPQVGPTAGQETQLAYWTAFSETGADVPGTDRYDRKPGRQNWMSFGIGRSGVELLAVAARGDPAGLLPDHHIRVELVFYGDAAEARYEQIGAQRGEIDSGLGISPTWVNPESGWRPRIYVSKAADVDDRDDWPNQHRWLLKWLQKFDDVFRPLVQNLDG